jgi:hypothetical protein
MIVTMLPLCPKALGRRTKCKPLNSLISIFYDIVAMGGIGYDFSTTQL